MELIGNYHAQSIPVTFPPSSHMEFHAFTAFYLASNPADIESVLTGQLHLHIKP